MTPNQNTPIDADCTCVGTHDGRCANAGQSVASSHPDSDSMALIKAEQLLNGWAAEEGNFHSYAQDTAKAFIKSREILRRFVDLYQGHTERMHSEKAAIDNCTVCSARRLLS